MYYKQNLNDQKFRTFGINVIALFSFFFQKTLLEEKLPEDTCSLVYISMHHLFSHRVAWFSFCMLSTSEA